MGLNLITAPALEPLTLQECKDFLRVDDANDDSVIEPMISAVREYAEAFTARALVTQTWDVFLDWFPRSAAIPIRLPMPPLQSVTSIKYIDPDGVEQTWTPALYTVDGNVTRPRVVPAFNEVYPTTRQVINAVTIRMVVGYGSNPEQDVPREIKQGMLTHLGHLYEHRESVIVGTTATPVPFTTDNLLYPYRVASF
ncbi:MAG: phage head-tail connector protein [Proteobacteria bacterium]|nr:phage head-tail connector protein [Pseudomonadota bacterium]